MNILDAIRGRRSASRPDAAQRLQVLEERTERLELNVQDLQDSTHRQFVLHDKRLDDLTTRTDPHRLAQALSEDARRRGTS